MSKELKSRSFIETNKLNETIVLNEANSFDIPADLYNLCVLEPAGITLDQEKKRQKLEAEFLPSSVLVGGEQVAERFKTNPDLHEVSMNLPLGVNRTASVVYTRDQATVIAVNTKIETAEMKRVISYIDDLFTGVSN